MKNFIFLCSVFAFTSAGFILIVIWYVLSYLLTNLSSNLSIETFFETKVMYLYILFLKVLMNLSVTTDLPSLFVEYISIAFFSSHDFIDLVQNSLPLSTHILFGLLFDVPKIFWKALVILIPFLSFKGIAHGYLL